jgi:hypothetical protein
MDRQAHLWQGSNRLLITIAVNLYDIAKWIFTEHYLISLIWDNFLNLTALFAQP